MTHSDPKKVPSFAGNLVVCFYKLGNFILLNDLLSTQNFTLLNLRSSKINIRIEFSLSS